MGYWYADIDLNGEGNCGHRHETAREARRCLPAGVRTKPEWMDSIAHVYFVPTTDEGPASPPDSPRGPTDESF